MALVRLWRRTQPEAEKIEFCMKKYFYVVLIILIVLVASGTGYHITRQNDNKTAPQNSNNTPDGTSKTLDLSGQQLTTIPESVLDQIDITSLNLSNNQLVTLPPGIGKMTNLKVLNVENNRLVTLPVEIGQLKNLTSADFSNNRLASLPPELGTLTQLKSLNLDGYKSSQSDIDELKVKLPNTEIRT